MVGETWEIALWECVSFCFDLGEDLLNHSFLYSKTSCKRVRRIAVNMIVESILRFLGDSTKSEKLDFLESGLQCRRGGK